MEPDLLAVRSNPNPNPHRIETSFYFSFFGQDRYVVYNACFFSPVLLYFPVVRCLRSMTHTPVRYWLRAATIALRVELGRCIPAVITRQ